MRKFMYMIDASANNVAAAAAFLLLDRPVKPVDPRFSCKDIVSRFLYKNNCNKIK